MWLYIVIVALVAIAAAGTLIIGNSKENRTGNPDYDKRTKKNLIKLTLIYGGSILIIALLLVGLLDLSS
ncbi:MULTISPECIES: hypothetical protein [Paenibacillus]|uniref:Uncharacterized protein n=1 Tax=Paenibacillus vini TaxID=1476024 RepID=A0ABQ4MCH4_9BACL|nr:MULTISPECIES: hypothetical protein [Paenibacillus]MBQ4898140.1 hypothetical protein [Paenibacillus sp. Marseille-P2973]MDN4071025.1 hypothetical protein [Paenibacillus vini]GIP53677.1 hypothetical protein J42TS3_27120 [Paenibacillus vini]